MELTGQQFIGYKRSAKGTRKFKAVNPATMQLLVTTFFCAEPDEVEEAMQLAAKAFEGYKNTSSAIKANFLRDIATGLNTQSDALIDIIHQEAALLPNRITSELARTIKQLELYANLLEEGSWVEAKIDTGDAHKPDLRKMMKPIGPIVVFGASNFPLAYSVAGGDTASALAVGCPVVVKAHPAHPGTSEIVAQVVVQAAQKNKLPEGVFSMLFDDGFEVGATLTKHPLTKAVGFTGSFNGGMALHKLSQQRNEPIPVFAEMGSVNPIVIFPEALKIRREEIAKSLAKSITIGAGQFCTKPGLMFAIKDKNLPNFESELKAAVNQADVFTMLTPGIHSNYQKLKSNAFMQANVEVLAEIKFDKEVHENKAEPTILRVSAKQFIQNSKLHHEVFGPFSILVVCADYDELKQAVSLLGGQLTLTLQIETSEFEKNKTLIAQFEEKAGRIVMNGVPTGVEVNNSIQHGGPYPSTTDSRFTSVGTDAVKRWIRPVVYQNWDDALLPKALQESNPLNIWRLYNNEWKR